MDKLTTMTGCTLASLLNTLTFLFCSSSGGKTFHSAVHFPTETVVSQLKHELLLQSIADQETVGALGEVVAMLESATQSDSLLEPNTLDSSMPNMDQLMSAMGELVENYNTNAIKQRQAVEKVSISKGVEPQVEDTLERPPLQERRRRDADNVLNDIKSTNPDCAITKLASTFCTPTDATKGIDNLVKTYATSLAKLEQARHTLLKTIVQSQDCSAPGVTGNQLAWASLGTSEHTLVGVLSNLLEARKLAQEQLDKVNSNGNDPLGNLDSGFGALLSEFPGLLGSSMGQLGEAAGGMGSSMGQLGKPGGGQKKGGFFQFFGR